MSQKRMGAVTNTHNKCKSETIATTATATTTATETTTATATTTAATAAGTICVVKA